MTIPSTPRKAGPLLGDGAQTEWPFTFKVFAGTDVQVTIADADGVETVLTSNYSVELNANQETSPGGTVTYPVSGTELPTGSVLSITGDLDYDQPLDLPGGGNFSPLALENQLDRMTMQLQQLAEEVDRAARLPVTSTEDADALVADLVRLADSADNIDTVAGSVSSVNTVATDIADVNTVAAVAGAVAATAANIAAVVAVGNDLLEPSSEIDTVAGAIANINTVGSNIADVTAVAAIVADVSAVAAIVADVSAVADSVADVTNFADVYQGAKATDPALRNNGGALQAGDLYFNTTDSALRVYSGTAWGAGAAGTISVTPFSGDGVETEFALPTAPASENNTQVYISGVYQQKDQYSVSGVTITFAAAPPAGTDNIEVVTIATLALGETDAPLVSYTPAGAGAVVTDVQSKLREFVSVKDFGAVGDGVTDDTAAIQAAFARAAILGRATINGVAGDTYVVSSKISITAGNVSLLGDDCRFVSAIANGDPLFEIATPGVNFVNFEGFSIEGGTGHGIAAIGAGGAVQAVRVVNVRCSGIDSATAKDHAGSSMPAYGIYVYGVYTLRVQDGYAQNGSGGIYCDNAQKIKVSGWNGDELTDYGIFLNSCLAADVSGQNTLTGCGGAGKSGFYVNGCEAVTFDSNRIKGGSGTYALLTGDTLTRRLTVSNNGFEVYTPSAVCITSAVESFAVRDNLFKFIGGEGPFTDGILLTDLTGGGRLSFAGEISGNEIVVGGSDTLTNGVNINVSINSARALRVGNNTIGGGGVASVVTNGINLQGTGVGNSVYSNAFAVVGGSVVNGVVVGSAQTTAKLEDNIAIGTVSNLVVDSGVRTRIYESGSGNLTLTGCTTSPTGGYTYERNGRTVTMKILTVSATSNTTAATLTGVPASIQPASNQWCYVPLFDNGLESQGFAQIGASGTITLSKDIVSGAFTNTGVKGIRATAITWQL